MKKVIFLIALSITLFQLNGFGQKNKKAFVSLGQTEVGTLTNSERTIVGDCFEFPKGITSMSIDPKTETELVLLGGKGLACNLNSGETLWEVKKAGDIFYQSHTNSFLVGWTDGIYSSTDCFSMTDGAKKWHKGKGKSTGFYPLCEDPTSALIVGTDGYELRGLDTNSGNIVWQRKLKDRDAGTPFHTKINDSTILVVTGGIHTVNLSTGEGWSYKVKTGDKSLKKAMNQRAIGAGIAGGMGGLVGGMIGGAVMGMSNTGLQLSYGSLTIEENSVTYTNKEEQIKLSLNDGSLIEQTSIAKQDTKQKKEKIEFYFTYNDLRFKNENKMIEVYRDEKHISTLDISQIVFVKDNILYGNRDKTLYRINLEQLN